MSSDPSRELLLPPKSHSVLTVHDEARSASCVLLYLQLGQEVPSLAAIAELFLCIVR
jgi:hypothetical protein